MNKWFYLIVGSIAGGIARYVLAGLISKKFGTTFPYGTLIVNLTGCFLIGIFFTLAEEKLLLGANEKILLMTGFCGAYTTFSAFILETSTLISAGEYLGSFLNIFLSVAIGFLFFRIGALLGKWV